MVQRVTYRRRHSYNTKSNKTKIVKTPGGRLVIHYRKKLSHGPRCGDCGGQIQGLPRLRSIQYSRISKCQRSVNRAYGGSRCANCTRNRIVRAFLIEEQKIVKHVIKMKTQQHKTAALPAKAETKPAQKGKAGAKGKQTTKGAASKGKAGQSKGGSESKGKAKK